MAVNPQLILAMLAGQIQTHPQEAMRIGRALYAARKGNFGPAIKLGMELLQQQRPAVAQQVGYAARQVADTQEPHDKAKFFRRFESQKYGIYLIIGGRGTGKTALALRLAEILKRPTYAIGIPKDVCPNWIETEIQNRDTGKREILTPSNILSLPGDSVILVDDASLFVSTAQAQSAAMHNLQELVNICRHVSITIILDAQQAAALYKYTMDADALFLKPPSLLFKSYERPEIAPYFQATKDAFDAIPESDTTRRLRSVYVVSQEYIGMMEFDKPADFTARQSKNKAGRLLDAEYRVLPNDDTPKQGEQ